MLERVPVEPAGWEHRHLWTRFNSKQTFLGTRAQVTSVAFSADGKRIVSGSEDNTVKVWDADDRPGSLHPPKGTLGGLAG